MRQRIIGSWVAAIALLPLTLEAVEAPAAPAIANAGAPLRLSYGGTVGPPVAPTSCQAPVARSVLPFPEVQHLGVHTVGDTVVFHVPPGTGSISIIEQAVGSIPATISYGAPPPDGFPIPNSAVITLLTEPDGTVLYDDFQPYPADLTTMHLDLGLPEVGTSVATLPNTSQALFDSRGAGYPPGHWSVEVNDYAFECTQPVYAAICFGGTTTDRYDITVITKPIAPRAGSVNVSVYLATEALTARTAVASPSMHRFVNTVAGLYAQAGIGLDRVTIYDLPDWAKLRYASGVDAADTGPCSNLAQLLTLSRPANELAFFFVDAILVDGGNFNVVGIDGSIPGPASLGGTIASGSVVTASDLGAGTCGPVTDFANCGADSVAYIAAHEGGHYMGLYHTTEATGDNFDPLRDTPTCTCSACFDAAHAALCEAYEWYKDAATCTQTRSSPCGGGNNLMFWVFDTTVPQGVLSPEQAKVMRANPLVQSGD